MMVRRELIRSSAGGSLLAMLSGCGLIRRTASYRVRMTVEVETPQDLRTGSSVLQISADQTVRLMAEERTGGIGMQGHAVRIELPKGPLFVLTRPVSYGDASLPSAITEALDPTAVTPRPGENPSAVIFRAVQQLGGSPGVKANLPKACWPLMVSFADIERPDSVMRVDADAEGVRRITLETTTEDVSGNLDGTLPDWFATYRKNGSRLDGSHSIGVRSDAPFAGRIYAGDF